MNTAAWTTAAFSASLAGFAALSLAMDRHFEDSYGRGRAPGRWLPWLRLGGVSGLLVSLWACLVAQGTGQGWVLYGGVLTSAALAVALVLACAPRWAAWVMAAGLAVLGLAFTGIVAG